MIVVDIKVHPGGSTLQSKLLGTMTITNLGTGNYLVEMLSTRGHEHASLEGFDRTRGAVALVAEAFKAVAGAPSGGEKTS